MEGDFFTIGQKNNNNNNTSTQQMYLNKFQGSNNNTLANPAEDNMQNTGVDNALVDNKPGSFLF